MNAQCIMVCSGKGGTGKSTVSVLLGACLARLGRKTLLVELDSGLRSVDIIAGVYGRTVYDIEDVLCGRCEGAKAVVPSPLYPGLSVISAPYEGGAVEAAPLGRLLTAMRPYFDFILLDTAAGMGAPFTAASTVADKALLVLTPDPVALRDGKIVADRLLAGGRPQSAVRLVMNRVRRESFGKNAAVADLDECIDTVGALFDLDDGHRIVHDFLEGRNLGVHLADLGFESLDPALQVVHILPQFRVVIVVATRQQGGGNKEQCAHAGGQSPHRKKSHSNLFKLNKSRVGYMTAQHQVSADNII